MDGAVYLGIMSNIDIVGREECFSNVQFYVLLSAHIQN